MTNVASICKTDNKLQKQLRNAKTNKQKQKARKKLTKLHNQYSKATDEQKKLNKMMKKYGG